MFGFVTRRDPATGIVEVDVPWVIDLIRAFGLVVVIVTVSLASPQPGTDSARGLAIAVALGLSAAAWIVWLLSGNGRWTGMRRWMNLGGLQVDRHRGQRVGEYVVDVPGDPGPFGQRRGVRLGFAGPLGLGQHVLGLLGPDQICTAGQGHAPQAGVGEGEA